MDRLKGARARHAIRRAGVALALLASMSAARADLSIAPGVSLALPPGASLDLGCTNLDVQGSYAISSGSVGKVTNLSIGPAGSFQAGSGTISLSGNWSNAGSFVAGGGRVVFNDDCGAAPALIGGTTRFHDLTLGSALGRDFVIAAGASISISGTLTLAGAPGLPVRLVAAPGAGAVVNLLPGARLVSSNAVVPADVRIVTAAPTAVPSLGGLGLGLLSLLLAGLAVIHKRSNGVCHEPV